MNTKPAAAPRTPPGSVIPMNESSPPRREYSFEEMRAKVWGPYYWLSQGTCQLYPNRKHVEWWKNIFHWLPAFVSVGVLVAWNIYIMIRMMDTIALSLDWAYINILFFQSLHSMVSAFSMLRFKKDDFFRRVTDHLILSSRNNITIRMTAKLILQFSLVYFFFVMPAIVFLIENAVMYHYDIEVSPVVYNLTKKETMLFRKSMLGSPEFYIIDAITILWAGYVSASASTVYLLANRAICYEYAQFNKELKEKIASRQILKQHVMKEVELRVIHFISAARYAANSAASIVDLTFMTGLFMQICAQFVLIAFSRTIHFMQNALFGLWTAMSIALLVMSTRLIASFYVQLSKTTDMIWLDDALWGECDDVVVRESARTISERIHSVDYNSKSMTPTKAANLVFNMVLFIIPFFVDILANYKYVPPAMRTLDQ